MVMADADFTIADVLAWARTKPADERYDYTASSNCALCQFLRETGRGVNPSVGPDGWSGGERGGNYKLLPAGINNAVQDVDSDAPRTVGWTFGELVKRLEKLCPKTIVPPSEWTRLDAYMLDIELASA
jgi:hypothetical protein